ncbi:hypothetical protein SASPL_105244 [Salvia splendens]|uniref:Uncharacterized protein n=1 Tax=Salvia splendens TaxID=180675 RepID=A0A8X8YLC4_SALSN|nr:hypothetical protein SASPL_105244 [Salvia splendens]
MEEKPSINISHLWTEDEPEYLSSPENYFGNCLIFLQAKSSHGRLRGAVRRVLEGFEEKFDSYLELKGKRVTTLAGSSRIDLYGGGGLWMGKAVGFCMGRDGGIEMGLPMASSKMDALI